MTEFIRRAVAIGAALGLVVAGCGDDDEDIGSDDTVQVGDDAAADDAGTEVAVTATNFAFTGLPDTIAAGTVLKLTNAASDELHEIVAIRIPDGEDRSVSDLLQLSEEELAEAVPDEGPPAAVIIAPPGEEGMAVVGDGSLSEPGRYAIVCFIPIGADPAEYMDPANQSEDGPPDVDGGPPHFTNGMFAELVVE